MTTIEQLTGITAQHNEIVKRVGNGSLDPIATRRALQSIIEGRFPGSDWNPPVWWRTPDRQLDLARQLWPNADLPNPPSEFRPQTRSEVLLLHVPDSFESLWEKTVAPTGYTKHRDEKLFVAGDQSVRTSPSKQEYTKPVWLAFDPEHGRGERPDSLWFQDNTAGSEILSALIQFPDWPLAWHNNASDPNLCGYQVKYKDEWPLVPSLTRSVSDNTLRLSTVWADSRYGIQSYYRHTSRSSPTVREC